MPNPHVQFPLCTRLSWRWTPIREIISRRQ